MTSGDVLLKEEHVAFSFFISDTFATISGKHTIILGDLPGNFAKKYHEQAWVKCAVDSKVGCLYPLSTPLVFLESNNILWIKFDDIESIYFHNYNDGMRNFDLAVMLKDHNHGKVGGFFSCTDFVNFRGLYRIFKRYRSANWRFYSKP